MIADRIKELRESKGWTQAELARRLGVTRNGVNSWEQGLSSPSLASLIDLTNLFNVSADYILGIDSLNTVNVKGLDKKDIALVNALIDRLREPRG